MLYLNDTVLEVVAGGRNVYITKISNSLRISANGNRVEDSGMILFNINQFNGKQVNVTSTPPA